jgi:hypothetical protein
MVVQKIVMYFFLEKDITTLTMLYANIQLERINWYMMTMQMFFWEALEALNFQVGRVDMEKFVKCELKTLTKCFCTFCHNFSFGLATKAKGLQRCEPRESPGVTSHTPGSVGKCEVVNPYTPKATPTLGDGVSMDSKNFRKQFQGSKLNVLCHFLYHWKTLGT